jgi:hypothetical protein
MNHINHRYLINSLSYDKNFFVSITIVYVFKIIYLSIVCIQKHASILNFDKWMYSHTSTIGSLTCGSSLLNIVHFSHFLLFAIMNKGVMNINVQVYF